MNFGCSADRIAPLIFGSDASAISEANARPEDGGRVLEPQFNLIPHRFYFSEIEIHFQ